LHGSGSQKGEGPKKTVGYLKGGCKLPRVEGRHLSLDRKGVGGGVGSRTLELAGKPRRLQ